MDYQAALEVYKAQTQNVRSLDKVINQIKRTINNRLKIGNNPGALIQTKILALTYSAWAEVSFSKLIHTPYGFNPDEMKQIKDEHKKGGLERGWQKCLELALRKLDASTRTNEVPNIRQKLSRYIKTYIIEPSIIRNKIAHGQWTIALNEGNTAANQKYTDRIADLDIVRISIWIRVYEFLENIIEDLIESPNRAFRRDYWGHLTGLDEFLSKAEDWSLQDKAKLLKKKYSYKPKAISFTRK